MAVKFQYNKTSLQQQEKQLKVRVRALPTIKSKESALRMEVKRTKDEVERLENELEMRFGTYDNMKALWNELDPSLLEVKDVKMVTRKIAGVVIPLLSDVEFNVKPFSLAAHPAWFMEGLSLVKELATVGIQAEFERMKMNLLEHARKKTTQKVNLFEKVQIPGYQDAIRKIKRYLEDEESLAKAAQKIMRANLERKAEEEVKAV